MKRYSMLVALFCLAAFVASGCKPSTKNELQYWDNNKKDCAEAIEKYPAFKDVLTAKLAEAQKLWDAAATASGEEEKAKQMKAANDKLNELLNQFTQIKHKSKGVEDAIAKLNAMKLTKSEDNTRKLAVGEANKALGEVRKLLADATPASEEDAKAVTGDAISKLISAQGAIDRAIKSLEPKKSTTKKK